MTTKEHQQINTLSIVGSLDAANRTTELHFTDGRIVRVPTALLQQEEPLENLQESSFNKENAIVIPLVEEQLQVAKRTVETGKVQLHKSVEVYDVTLNEPLTVNTWKVERLAKHEVVASPPPTRQEGSTTVYPIVEERLVMTKELVLIEEIRVTREISERRETQTVTLRRETLKVEHQDS